MLTVVPDPADRGNPGPSSLIDEIVREGARRMLAEALAAEVDAYVAQFAAERGEDGRRLVVRNGYHQSREVLSGSRPARWEMYPLEGPITMTGHLSVTTTPVMDAYSPLAAMGTWWARPSDLQRVSHVPAIGAPGGRPTRR
jgi:hypothetical protein